MTVLLDWIIREGGIVLTWWLLVTLAGAAVLPLCFRLLGGLPDRGYTLARAVGLLLVGFAFWLLASYGLLLNRPGGMAVAWLIVVAVSLVLFFRGGDAIDLRHWWRENKWAVITAELLFILLLFAWAIFRAYQNDTATTEKPMELAFISGVMRSDTFPPNDPWLAGYAISYYYFGYVMAAMLSMLSGVSSTVGFSMTTVLMFALTGLTAFGVAYNLVRSRAFVHPVEAFDPDLDRDGARRPRQPAALMVGLLATVFVILLGNFQLPLIEMPYQARALPDAYFSIWDTQQRTALPGPQLEGASPFTLDPSSVHGWDGWWWFRASRVLSDRDLDGELIPVQPIDEFPQFSFILSDNHPHVLALPFAVLALGLALNLLLRRRDPIPNEIFFYGIAMGGLIFLNTWDGPIYIMALVGADALRRLMRQADGRLLSRDWLGLIAFGGALLLVAIAAYFPFFIGFRSQAAGLLPNLMFPTWFGQYFIMFGPFLLLLVYFLAAEVWRGRRSRRLNLGFGIRVTLGLLLVLVVIAALLTLVASFVPQLRVVVDGYVAQYGGWDLLLPALLEKRLTHSLTAVILLLVVVLVVARLFPVPALLKRRMRDLDADAVDDDNQMQHAVAYPAATGFALLLLGMGAVLSLVPEFFYLRDNFGVRINTIFKFYYQVWVMFSLASAYAVYTILSDRGLPRVHRVIRYAFGLTLVLVLVMGLTYPVFAAYTRMFVERLSDPDIVTYLPQPSDWVEPSTLVTDGELVQPGQILMQDNADLSRLVIAPESGQVRLVDGRVQLVALPTLDGGPIMTHRSDYAVAACLAQQVAGDEVVAVEAVRDAYNAAYGRLGALTGIPVLMGWENHERQWRGAAYPELAGTRSQDIQTLYMDLRWDVALNIINRYGIDYIVYGITERNQYGAAGEIKFADNLDVICEQGDSRIYHVAEDVASAVLPDG